MNKIYFAIALHFHQPIGNFEKVIERAYNSCYGPFFRILSDYPEVKVMIHISGCLLDYFDSYHPEAIEFLKTMVDRGQVEMMGGGYYEPILTAIPERDVIGQIEMMSEYIKKRFGSTPKGMWIAERVWKPEVAPIIHKAGVRYSILDDEHFIRSGVKEQNMHGYFLTDSGKEKIAIFPSDKKLRYMIPFKPPEETINYFKELAGKKKGMLFTYGDDGEKFGEWPGTYSWVYESQWLVKFFDALTKNKDWIELVHFAGYLKKHKVENALTVKQGSYKEMMEWSDGCWLNFLSKYEETNQMHKKMNYISSKLEKIAGGADKADEKNIEKARIELYKGQCNCAYWHGVFGGLYLYHLRNAIYKHLIESEKILDSLIHKDASGWLDINESDFYMNGKSAYTVENKEFSICVDQRQGGIIKELDYKPIAFNLVNTLSRKKEAYHQKILDAKEGVSGSKVATIHDDFRTVDPAFKNMLIYDKFGRYFFRTYFVKKDLKLDDFMYSSYKELGSFSNAAYEARIKGEKSLVLEHEGSVLGSKIKLEKRINLRPKGEIEIECSAEKKSASKLNALLGAEFNITMPDLNSDRYHYSIDNLSIEGLNSHGSLCPVSSFGIEDSAKECGIIFNFSKQPAAVLYFPVKTISQSERAYELNYQCSCLFFLWEPEFGKNNMFDFKMKFVIVKSAG